MFDGQSKEDGIFDFFIEIEYELFREINDIRNILRISDEQIYKKI